jgi:tRNA wybutosine-synthesizing protein 3
MAAGVDRSKQGSVDKDIEPLLEKLNSSGYQTTSSCSGRIVLLRLDENRRKDRCEWLYKTHHTANPAEVFRILEKSQERLWFMQEPVIVHVNCPSLEKAGQLLEAAKKAGFKHSGIFSLKNFSVEIRGSERMEALLVPGLSKGYIEELVEEANRRLGKAKEKMERLMKIVSNHEPSIR